MNLVQRAVSNGGKLAPIVISDGLHSGTGLMNPSVFIDSDGDILVNLRHVNYTLCHSENTQKFPNRWGPLSYLHPEKDQTLRTENYLCRLDKNLSMINSAHVDMLELHTPIWEFIGLEDARLVQWDNQYYLVGVRRDTTTNGQGRMEYSHISIDKDKWEVKETKRIRIPAPGENNSYCEKNWVPVLDKPYHFVKWTSPVEIVKADPNEEKCEQVSLRQGLQPEMDQRGGSQLVRWGNMYISITHDVVLFKNYLHQKDAVYRHRLLVWDDQLNLVGISRQFSFLDGMIEFAVGAAIFEDDLLITFGFQDNAAFILRTPKIVIEELIVEALSYGI
jgi:predicted GH43/DUF377 family glycosyl hydrolase